MKAYRTPGYIFTVRHHTRRRIVVALLPFILVTLCASGIPATSVAEGTGIKFASGWEWPSSSADLQGTPDYPVVCTGAEVIAEISSGDGFLAEDIRAWGDLTGDGKMDIGGSFADNAEPFRIWDFFSGSDFSYIGDLTAGANPFFYPEAEAALGNVYGGDADPEGRKGELGLFRIWDGTVYIYSDIGEGEDWAEVAVLNVPANPMGGSQVIFSSTGDLLTDNEASFVVSVDTTLYVFAGVDPYPQVYTIVLEARPKELTTVGDLDEDGIPDFAVSLPAPDSDTGSIVVFSGAGGRELARIQGESGDRLGGYNSLAYTGDPEDDGSHHLLVGSDRTDSAGVREYVLRNGEVPQLLRNVAGSEMIEPMGDADFDGKKDWLMNHWVMPQQMREWGVRLSDGNEAAYCQAADGHELGWASAAADSDNDGYAEFAIGVPTAHKLYVLELLPRTKPWTVMVYMGSDSNRESGAIKDFLDLANVGSSANVNVVLQMDRIPEYDDRYDDWTETRRFSIRQGMEPLRASGVPINAGSSEANTGDNSYLIDFINWAKERYPAERYMLILWGHGSGFTIADDYTPWEEYDTLTLPELRAALEAVTEDGENPVDIMFLSSCLMADIELASQLILDENGLSSNPLVKVLVASQENMYGISGLDYSFLLTTLAGNPDIPLNDLSTEIVDKYEEQLIWADTLSAVDLGSPYPPLIRAVDDFALALLEEGKPYSADILDARAVTKGFSESEETGQTTLVDLYDIASNIQLRVSNTRIINTAEIVKNLIGDNATPGGAIIHVTPDLDFFNQVIHGISIYFPLLEEDYNPLYSGDQNFVRLSAETLWDEWLHAFYNPDRTPVRVTVLDAHDNPVLGSVVLAMDGDWSTSLTGITDRHGRAYLFLPDGHYRFRTTVDGNVVWSGPVNHCAIPGCSTVTIRYGSVDLTVQNSSGQAEAGVYVQPFQNGFALGAPALTDMEGRLRLWLASGRYTFRITKPDGEYWTSSPEACEVPTCTSATVTTIPHVTVIVRNTEGQLQAGWMVRAMSGEADTGIEAVTDAQGQVSLALPQGSYFFRAEKDGVQYFSAADNHCDAPGCANVDFTLEAGITVTVHSSHGGVPDAGVRVFAFDGETYTGRYDDTDSAGIAKLLLPPGTYRFRVDARGMEFWSGPANHCTVPDCTSVEVETPSLVVVTVRDPNGVIEPDLIITAYDGDTPTGFSAVTDEYGEARLFLPVGDYRFQTVADGTTYWSGSANHCSVPSCESAFLRTGLPVVITVTNSVGEPWAGIFIRAFDGIFDTGVGGLTDAEGKVTLHLTTGSYRFRIDLPGGAFWSAAANHCEIPGCSAVTVTDAEVFSLFLPFVRHP